MPQNPVKSNGHEPDNDSLTFELVKGNENLVKAVSFDKGKKREVFVYVISEEQFDELIPFSEKNGNGHIATIDTE